MSKFKGELIKYRIERANETLKEAKLLAENNHFKTCVNRLYYACFYAVNALLYKHNLSSSKHSGVRALFNQHFIKSKIIPHEWGKIYSELFDLRQESDYEDFFHIEPEEIVPYIAKVDNFIQTISDKLENK